MQGTHGGRVPNHGRRPARRKRYRRPPLRPRVNLKQWHAHPSGERRMCSRPSRACELAVSDPATPFHEMSGAEECSVHGECPYNEKHKPGVVPPS